MRGGGVNIRTGREGERLQSAVWGNDSHCDHNAQHCAYLLALSTTMDGAGIHEVRFLQCSVVGYS